MTELSSTGPTEISSEAGIVLRCGKSSIHLAPDCIEIDSPTIVVKGSGGSVSLGDDKVKIKPKSQILGLSDDKVFLKRSSATVSLAAEAKIDGDKVKLKSADSVSDSPSDPTKQPTTITLVDDHGDPIPFERHVYPVDRAERGGLLDKDGKAEVDLDAAAKIPSPASPRPRRPDRRQRGARGRGDPVHHRAQQEGPAEHGPPRHADDRPRYRVPHDFQRILSLAGLDPASPLSRRRRAAEAAVAAPGASRPRPRRWRRPCAACSPARRDRAAGP